MFTGHWEWFVILLIAVLLFGSRLPKVMRSLGRSAVEFKRGLKEVEEDVERESDPKPKREPPASDETPS